MSSKCAPQEALRDLDLAYKNFYRRATLKKQGKWKGKVGFPTFKKRSKGVGSFRLTAHIHVTSSTVQWPRIGKGRWYEHGYIPPDAKILSATVSEQAGRWLVSVQVEEQQEQPVCTATTAIGVDLGIKTLATLSDGTPFENPRPLKQALRRWKRLERQKSRRKKGSKNRKQTGAKLAQPHARLATMRKDASHKLTSSLCKNHALLAIEDLPVAGMVKNQCLAQAVSDSTFGEIRRQLEYKAQWHGVHLVVLGRFSPSSQVCRHCQCRNEALTLADRVFVCQNCGAVTDRDYNAAQNRKRVAVSSIDTQNACGQRGAGPYRSTGETALVEAGTKGDVWALSPMSMF